MKRVKASTPRACAAEAQYGSHCCELAMGDSDYCYWHRPGYRRGCPSGRDTASRGSSDGWQPLVGAAPVIIRDAMDVLFLIERAANDALALENSPERAKALNSLAQTALQALQQGEIEEMLRSLEARSPQGFSRATAREPPPEEDTA